MHTIVSLRADAARMELELKYSDGVVVVVDFEPIIRVGGVATRLLEPGVFSGVRIGERGRWVDFGDEVEFCADALRERGVVTDRTAA
jgi:hypothetical protein